MFDASLFETALGWLGGAFASYTLAGKMPERHPTGSAKLIPFQAFQTKTGPLVIAVGNDRLFAALAGALDRPEWKGDPELRTNAGRYARRHELLPAIEAVLRTRPREEWLERLEQAGVPCAPVRTLPEVLAEPQTDATGMVQDVPGLDLRLMGLPLRFDGGRPPLRRSAPALGEHNGEVLDG